MSFSSVTNIITLNNYLLNTNNRLTFIQVTKGAIPKINDISLNNPYHTNSYYEYINNTEIYNNFYSINNKPILLLYIKYNNVIKIASIPIIATPLLEDIKNLVHSGLSIPSNINELQLYLKFTKYDTTFIRIINIKPTLNKEYILLLLEEYNKIYNKKYEFIEINSNNLNNYYKTYTKSLPSIMIFKKAFYADDTALVPCKYLSGEIYLLKQITALSIFLKNGLKK